MNGTPRRVLVTGAGGLVGRAVCARLAADGDDVLPVLRPGAETGVALDLTRQDLTPVLARHGSTAVVHCAALVPTNPEHPDSPESAAGTTAIDANVHRAAKAAGARVLYFSSCGLYDPRDAQTKTEDSSVVARSPYFAAKLAGEQLVSSLPGSVAVRLSGPVGPGMRRQLVLPRFVATALRGEELTLWGSGSREQDFVDAGDVADFVARALANDVDGTFNVAAGRPVTMRELADLAVAAAGRGSVRLADRPDPLDGETARYSTARAGELGWTPVTGLDTMLRRMVEELDVTAKEG